MDARRLWTFQADMNADGVITITDVKAWLSWLFFYPGDLVIYGTQKLIGPDRWLSIATFFEYDPWASWYGGYVSGVLSGVCWIIALGWLAVLEEWSASSQ